MRKEVVDKEIFDRIMRCYNIYFNNLYELVNYIETTPIAPSWEHCNLASSRRGLKCFNFTGTNSLEEAIDLCLSPSLEMELSYLENLKYFVNEIKVLAKQRRMIDHFYGGTVSVSKYLYGNPRCMKKIQRIQEYPSIKIYLNCGYSANEIKEYVILRGMCVIIFVEWLELLGFKVDFNFFELSVCMNEISYVNVTLKKTGELLDIRNTYFPICHPSFLRRLIFAIQERTNYRLDWSCGYGTVPYDDLIKEFLSLDQNSIVINDFSFVRYYSKSDIVNIKNSMIAFLEQYNIEQMLGNKNIDNLKILKKNLEKK